MTIKFITLNIFEGGLFFEAIVEFLRTEQPDIFVIQEVNDGQDDRLPSHLRSMSYLRQHFPEYESFFSPEILLRRPEGKIDIGNAIFSKFPIKQQETFFLSYSYGEYDIVPPDGNYALHPKNLQRAEIAIKDQTLNIFNLHGIWGREGQDNPARLTMSDIIVNQVKAHPNVILAGDFNVQPKTQTIANIERHLDSVFKSELPTAFNLKRKDLTKFPGYATSAVDMIFVSPDLQVINRSCPQVDVSDHLPLICELQL
jgi:endonuclease/exonuclease/phosphatase family metal-dependent hydrolase